MTTTWLCPASRPTRPSHNSHSPNDQIGGVRLSDELEKELFILHGEPGLRNETKGVVSFRQLVSHLRRHGAINSETEISLMEFREVRNQIAHAAAVPASILTSAIDSGIRLLRVIRGVPR